MTRPTQSNERDVYQNFRSSMSDWFKKQKGPLNKYGEYMMLPLDLIHLTVKLSTDDRVEIREKVELTGSAVYIVSPIDLLPEAFLGPIGLIDDAVVALLVLRKILSEIDPAILEEHWAGRNSTLYTVRTFLAFADQIPGDELINQLLSKLSI